MEKMKYTYLYMLLVNLLLMSCEFRTSDNGKLDGFWQVTAIDNKQSGETCDMRKSQMSWAFNGHLLVVRYGMASVIYEALFRFRHDGNELILYDPYKSNRDEGDVKIEDAAVLEELGIYSLEEQFTVLQLDDSSMLLESDRVVLHFRRY